ncbi:hypothetical protein HU200_021111 [Digitaria exilis]|uniref:Uncharacterized protein n=1 Tax=Digitaria exilis TaxID=1010633 RepID=A0A835F000_9POAL|nr:hypothetical protein HU200_021111 [Digitaria exilis]
MHVPRSPSPRLAFGPTSATSSRYSSQAPPPHPRRRADDDPAARTPTGGSHPADCSAYWARPDCLPRGLGRRPVGTQPTRQIRPVQLTPCVSVGRLHQSAPRPAALPPRQGTFAADTRGPASLPACVSLAGEVSFLFLSFSSGKVARDVPTAHMCNGISTPPPAALERDAASSSSSSRSIRAPSAPPVLHWNHSALQLQTTRGRQTMRLHHTTHADMHHAKADVGVDHTAPATRPNHKRQRVEKHDCSTAATSLVLKTNSTKKRTKATSLALPAPVAVGVAATSSVEPPPNQSTPATRPYRIGDEPRREGLKEPAAPLPSQHVPALTVPGAVPIREKAQDDGTRPPMGPALLTPLLINPAPSVRLLPTQLTPTEQSTGESRAPPALEADPMALALSVSSALRAATLASAPRAATARGYAASAASGAMRRAAAAAEGAASGEAKEAGRRGAAAEISWVPDPVTGHYRPSNWAAAADPADLRAAHLARAYARA